MAKRETEETVSRRLFTVEAAARIALEEIRDLHDSRTDKVHLGKFNVMAYRLDIISSRTNKRIAQVHNGSLAECLMPIINYHRRIVNNPETPRKLEAIYDAAIDNHTRKVVNGVVSMHNNYVDMSNAYASSGRRMREALQH